MAPHGLLELYNAKVRPRSQRALAKRLGVSHTALQKWESGGGMSPRIVFKIGKELDLSANEIIKALKVAG